MLYSANKSRRFLLFKIGDAVWWLSIAGDSRIERAGYIVAEVPAGRTPGESYPDGITCKLRGSPRTHVSYIIRIPDVSYVFWPQVASLMPLTDDKAYILTSQPKSKIHYVLKTVDQSDRKKIIILAMKMGDRFIETKEMVEVPAWGKRFWFMVSKGEEYVATVDRW